MEGDLQSFLRDRRPEDHPDIPPLTRSQIILMAAQIADGMAYLAGQLFIVIMIFYDFIWRGVTY